MARDDEKYGLFKDVMGMNEMKKSIAVQVCGGCGKLWGVECIGDCQTISPYADDAVLTEISKWATEYTDYLEVALTDKACLCKWIYRDPAPVKEVEEEAPKPRMRARSHEHPECPVHTKRGLLVGFFQWAMTEKGSAFINLFYADRVSTRFGSLKDATGTLEGTFDIKDVADTLEQMESQPRIPPSLVLPLHESNECPDKTLCAVHRDENQS